MRGYLVAKKFEKILLKMKMYDHFEFFDEMKSKFYKINCSIIQKWWRTVLKKKKEKKKKQNEMERRNSR